ncbi:putative membrane protein [Paraburkholderia youngii]
MTGARSLVGDIVSADLAFLVFTFGSLLVAIQVAGGQYTPRIIATTLLRDNVIRNISGLFVFTLLFANRTLGWMGDSEVHQLQVFIAALFGFASVVAFLFLIDYAAKFLRPVSLVARVGELGIAVIEGVYPAPATGRIAPPCLDRQRGAPDRIVRHRGTSGIVLAVNLERLVAKARRTNSVIEFVPQVGDFVAVDEPLFYLYGDAGAIDENRLRTLVAFGTERTMEQDPMFAFRILVDIALKALSAAINDPTTAVLAIDQLQRLLRVVGKRSLYTEEIRDKSGRVCVIFRTPNWEDFVHISFREIRQYGAGSIQIARRQRAAIENLLQCLPEHRHDALRVELTLLDREIGARHPFPEDLALARIPDSQGLGGSDTSAARQPVL